MKIKEHKKLGCYVKTIKDAVANLYRINSKDFKQVKRIQKNIYFIGSILENRGFDEHGERKFSVYFYCGPLNSKEKNE